MSFSRRRVALLLGSFVLAVGLAACSGGSNDKPSVASDSVAAVGDRQITLAAFNETFDTSKASFREQGRPVPLPGTSDYANLKNNALALLVQQAEVAEKAKTLGIAITDEQVDRKLAQIKKQSFAGSERKYRASLAKGHFTEGMLRAEIRAQLRSEEVFKKVTADVKLGDPEVARYYRAHRSEFTRPESRDVRRILVATKVRAERLERQLASGSDFAVLAEKYSADTGSKSLGGRLKGGVIRGRFPPSFERAVFSLRTHEVSAPVHSPYGWHVIEALSPVRRAVTTPLSQAKSKIRQQLLQRKREVAALKWLSGLKKEFASQVSYAPGYAPPSR